MKVRVYQYSNCGTCRKALKFLAAMGIDFIAVPIRETPPSKAELEMMLKRYGGQIRK
ncbi:MAG: arsenate reductase family protein, partial [Chloroflexi bacterium]|nr:arsenate reductase family protein [Chloroflexota bacterium]